jgi:hypothetical protein
MRGSMSHFERVVIGIPLAAVVPTYIPTVNRYLLARIATAGAIAIWTVFPAGVPTSIRVLAVFPVLLQATWLTSRPRWFFPAVVLLACATAVFANASHTVKGLDDLARDDAVLIVVAGWLIVTFALGWVIGAMTAPLAKAVADAVPEVKFAGLAGAGRYIGWLERSLLYGAILVGRVEIVAVVVALKSIARFPSLKQEVFADYFLIGTLLSLLAAIIISVLARVALSMPII